MHPRIQELMSYLDDRRKDLRAAVDEIPEHQREWQPSPDRWSVAGVLEHLAIVETRIDAVFRKKLAEARLAGIGNDAETGSVIDAHDTALLMNRTRTLKAPESLHPKTNTTSSQAWGALETARAAFRTTILDADGLALHEISHPHMAFGPMNLYKWIAFVGGHEARHTAQIREIGTAIRADPSLDSR